MDIKPDPRIIAKGIQYCLKNVESYIESAEILLKSGKFRQAFILDGFAREELGKIINIMNAPFYFQNTEKRKSWEKRFMDHKDKLHFGFDVDDIMNKVLPENENREEAELLFKKRMDAMYVNYKEEKFVRPIDISKEEVEESIKITKERLKFHKERHPSIEHDIETLIKWHDKIKDKTYEELRDMHKQLLEGENDT